MTRRWTISLPLVALAALLLSSCGRSGPRVPPGQPLTLVILSDGKPVTGARVILSGVGGGAELNEKGEGLLKHVPFGEYKVSLSPVLPESAVIPPADPAAALSKPAPPETNIPQPFRDETTTPWSINVQAGSPARIEFDLKKPKGP